jgi:hypothetical protein
VALPLPCVAPPLTVMHDHAVGVVALILSDGDVIYPARSSERHRTAQPAPDTVAVDHGAPVARRDVDPPPRPLVNRAALDHCRRRRVVSLDRGGYPPSAVGDHHHAERQRLTGGGSVPGVPALVLVAVPGQPSVEETPGQTGRQGEGLSRQPLHGRAVAELAAEPVELLAVDEELDGGALRRFGRVQPRQAEPLPQFGFFTPPAGDDDPALIACHGPTRAGDLTAP